MLVKNYQKAHGTQEIRNLKRMEHFGVRSQDVTFLSVGPFW